MGVLAGVSFGAGVAVGVSGSEGAEPPMDAGRNIRGATQRARSPVGSPLDMTVRMKWTVLPANELRSISTG